jgi:hypothetical protein
MIPSRTCRQLARQALSASAALALAALALPTPATAQARPNATAGYHTAARLSAAVDSIARTNRAFVTVRTLATSPGGRPVQLVRLGDSDEKPALLILAGAYGPQLASSEVALRIVREVATRHAAQRLGATLFNDYTIYVVPRLNPDASEAFFAPVRAERKGNDDKDDDDRDSAVDEDGPNDLNGDGLITMMRVRVGPGGEYLADSVDPAILRRADATKGEVGIYRLLTEGRDDDGDESFNEDGPGGTDISMNFAHNYPWFDAGSGLHPFSAAESRAVAEFVSTHDNIAAVYVLGMQDNLVKPWEGRRVPGIGGNAQGTSPGGPLTSTMPEDNAWFAEVSKRFDATPKTDAPASAGDSGDPLSWAYYHMGRFAFGSRVWWPGKAPSDTAAGRKAPTPDGVASERNLYRWMKANNAPGFVEWAPVNGFTVDGHPVEVGGFAPFALLNPAGPVLDSLGTKQADWVIALTRMLPRVSIASTRVESVGPRVWRVKVAVRNDGYLPTLAAIGVRSRLPMRVKVELGLASGQSVQSGRKLQYVNALRGSGSTEEFEWLVVGDAGSSLQLTVGSPNAGLRTQAITLRAGR